MLRLRSATAEFTLIQSIFAFSGILNFMEIEKDSEKAREIEAEKDFQKQRRGLCVWKIEKNKAGDFVIEARTMCYPAFTDPYRDFRATFSESEIVWFINAVRSQEKDAFSGYGDKTFAASDIGKAHLSVFRKGDDAAIYQPLELCAYESEDNEVKRFDSVVLLLGEDGTPKTGMFVEEFFSDLIDCLSPNAKEVVLPMGDCVIRRVDFEKMEIEKIQKKKKRKK
ncbi:hypothetical protein TRSA_24180 (plasmid) [Treponema saccharophilum]|uniref:Uncharacterized protein n=2 Tax=Treponema saccharophilum TaxID=165 RepID=H7EH54_9SPIR|nr:hypothetical protein TresaDRAFT_2739 [Treponema saccharophilum DSM 2985]BDC97319.1 hypothetical protein TRSA_24180 [Treponema saccharophilum]